MKRPLVTSAIVAGVLFGAASIADTTADMPEAPAFGEMAETLVLDDVWVDAERVFGKVDVDRDGLIDVDEYAAQAVVYAGLVRFNGVAVVDGRELIHVGLPTGTEPALPPAERAAIDAVARADFYALADADGAITPRRWVELRLEAFEDADRNDDGQLTGRELERFALDLARYDADDRWI